MSDIEPDPFAGVFGRFRDEIDDEIEPLGVAATRIHVRRRHRRRGATLAVAVVLAVIVPVTAYALGGAPAAIPTTTTDPSTSPSATPAPIWTSTSTLSSAFPGTLTYVSRAGKHASQMNATLIRVSGSTVVTGHIGDPAWDTLPDQPDGVIAPPDTDATGFAPDGTQMAFLANGGPAGLDVSGLGGADLRFLHGEDAGGCGSPLWSSDGTRIVYAAGFQRPQVTVLAPDGTQRRVVGTGCYPVFSADGTQIAYVQDQTKLIVVGVDGSGRHTVAPNIGLSRIRTIMSVADGLAIIDVEAPSHCGCDDGTRRWQLINPYVLNLATGALTRLPSGYGHILSAFYGADGSLLLRTSNSGTKPATITILGADGRVRASFAESILSTPTATVDPNHVDLVGYQAGA